MTLEAYGAALRQARLSRSLSLEQVAARLKISLRVLRALEDGDRECLPHSVYVRGFARDYGLFLGMDEADIAPVMLALGALGEDEADAPITTVYVPPSAHVSRGRGKFWLILLLAFCLAAGGFAWIYRDAELFSDIQLTRFLPARPAPAVKPAQTSSTAKKQEQHATSAPTRTPAATAPSPQPPAQPPGPTQQEQSAAQLNSTTQVNMPQAAPPTSLQAQGAGRTASSDQHKLVITALAECWVHSSADDADIRQFSLRKGDTFALTFQHKLTLKLGNAGGVRIRYNGTDLPPPGREGQVRTLTFPSTE